MKKILIIILLSFIGYATAQTYTLECDGFAHSIINEDTGIWNHPSDIIDCDITIIFNMDIDVIKINNKINDSFKITELLESNKGFDEDDGHIWSEIVLSVMDKDGDKAIITWRAYDYGIHMVSIAYSNIQYVYIGKPNEKKDTSKNISRNDP